MGARSNVTHPLWRSLRQIIFGLQDGLVSTLGAITGVAGATFDSFTIILTGLVLISVEALSMGAGEYLSSKSKKELWQRKIDTEKVEIKEKPREEHRELLIFLEKKGLSKREARSTAATMMEHPEWVLEEMAVHELGISPIQPPSPFHGSVLMFFSYMLGGLTALAPYFFLDPRVALAPSVLSTAIVLFVVGATKARYTTGRWVCGGLEMTGISLLAAGIGLLVGQLVKVMV